MNILCLFPLPDLLSAPLESKYCPQHPGIENRCIVWCYLSNPNSCWNRRTVGL